MHLTRLDGWGVRWRSFQEPFFDSCGIMRDVVISIMATLAEQNGSTSPTGTRRVYSGRGRQAAYWVVRPCISTGSGFSRCGRRAELTGHRSHSRMFCQPAGREVAVNLNQLRHDVWLVLNAVVVEAARLPSPKRDKLTKATSGKRDQPFSGATRQYVHRV